MFISSEITEYVPLFLLIKSVTTETREVYCYELKCVPTNTYVEVLAPSSADCDCIWREGPKEVIKVM